MRRSCLLRATGQAIPTTVPVRPRCNTYRRSASCSSRKPVGKSHSYRSLTYAHVFANAPARVCASAWYKCVRVNVSVHACACMCTRMVGGWDATTGRRAGDRQCTKKPVSKGANGTGANGTATERRKRHRRKQHRRKRHGCKRHTRKRHSNRRAQTEKAQQENANRKGNKGETPRVLFQR